MNPVGYKLECDENALVNDCGGRAVISGDRKNLVLLPKFALSSVVDEISEIRTQERDVTSSQKTKKLEEGFLRSNVPVLVENQYSMQMKKVFVFGTKEVVKSMQTKHRRDVGLFLCLRITLILHFLTIEYGRKRRSIADL